MIESCYKTQDWLIDISIYNIHVVNPTLDLNFIEFTKDITLKAMGLNHLNVIDFSDSICSFFHYRAVQVFICIPQLYYFYE